MSRRLAILLIGAHVALSLTVLAWAASSPRDSAADMLAYLAAITTIGVVQIIRDHRRER